MKIILDTNIVLDLLLIRAHFSVQARRIFKLIYDRKIEGVLCAHSITTIYYFLRKRLGAAEAKARIRDLLEICEIAAVDADVLRKALERPTINYEDSVITECASAAKANAIITRDLKDFRKSEVPATTPEEFLRMHFP